jgi:hypothetical protein
MDATQDRREFKFLLPPDLAPVIQQSVADHLAADRGLPAGYVVLSEYFDSPDRASYWEKIEAHPSRRRVRSRIYLDPSRLQPPVGFIEIKHKLDGQTVKRRMPASLGDLARFSAGRIPPAPDLRHERVRRELAGLLHDRHLRPVVRIRYHRQAFDTGPAGTLRVTFDRGLSCALPISPFTAGLDPDLPLTAADMVLMEVKTIGPVPGWFRQLAGRHRLSPASFSKYMTALDRHLPPLQPRHATR